MNTSKVNAQNPAFFDDLHAAFDRLETECDDCAVVLTGTGKVFSAGLDLDDHFAMYARRNLKEIDDWSPSIAPQIFACSPIPGPPWRR